MLYNGVFGCHGNTCYVICIGAIFYIIYSVCTDFEINRFRIDEVRKYATIVSTTSGSKVMAQIVVFVFSVTLTLTVVLFFFVTRIAHDALEYPCEASLESVQYEWVICCG